VSNRDTFTASVKTAVAAEVATKLTNAGTQQETINQSGVNVGYTLQSGNYANLKTAVDNARKAKFAADVAAEAAKNASIMVARDTLRATGDLAPF
jgi:hypothetical protein